MPGVLFDLFCGSIGYCFPEWRPGHADSVVTPARYWFHGSNATSDKGSGWCNWRGHSHRCQQIGSPGENWQVDKCLRNLVAVTAVRLAPESPEIHQNRSSHQEKSIKWFRFPGADPEKGIRPPGSVNVAVLIAQVKADNECAVEQIHVSQTGRY